MKEACQVEEEACSEVDKHGHLRNSTDSTANNDAQPLCLANKTCVREYFSLPVTGLQTPARTQGHCPAHKNLTREYYRD